MTMVCPGCVNFVYNSHFLSLLLSLLHSHITAVNDYDDLAPSQELVCAW